MGVHRVRNDVRRTPAGAAGIVVPGDELAHRDRSREGRPLLGLSRPFVVGEPGVRVVDRLDDRNPGLAQDRDRARVHEVRREDVGRHPAAPRPPSRLLAPSHRHGHARPPKTIRDRPSPVGAEDVRADADGRERASEQAHDLLQPAAAQRAGDEPDGEAGIGRRRTGLDRPRERSGVDRAANGGSPPPPRYGRPEPPTGTPKGPQHPGALGQGAIDVLGDRVAAVHAVPHVAQLGRVDHALRAELERAQQEVVVVHVPVRREAAERPPEPAMQEEVRGRHRDVLTADELRERNGRGRRRQDARVPSGGLVIGREGPTLGVDQAHRAEDERRALRAGHGPRVLDPLRLEDVVRVQNRDEVAPAFRDRPVDRRVRAPIVLRDDAHAGKGMVREDVEAPVPRPVVDDEQLRDRQRLVPHAVDGLPDEARVVVRRNDDGDHRAAGQPTARSGSGSPSTPWPKGTAPSRGPRAAPPPPSRRPGGR